MQKLYAAVKKGSEIKYLFRKISIASSEGLNSNFGVKKKTKKKTNKQAILS